MLIPLLSSVAICVCLSVVQGRVGLWEIREKSACYSGFRQFLTRLMQFDWLLDVLKIRTDARQ